MDACGFCAFAQFCNGTDDMYRCTRTDTFVNGSDDGCAAFYDEENGINTNANFSC